jgi:RHS repeat-associated protein
MLITAEPGSSGGLSAGLAGYWKFDENSGTMAADSSSSNNTGTLASGAAWNAGQSGSAVNLDGADDYVQVGAPSSLVMTSAASFSAWIYPTGAGSDATYGGTIVSKEGEYLLVRFPNGSIRWAFANTTPGWAFIDTGATAPLNQWTHVAVTYDSGVVKTYINGTLANTYNGAGSIGDANTSQNDFRIGGRQNISEYFQGRIDEVRVYNRALSASEVSGLSGAPTAELKGSWQFDENSGTTAADASGSGNTGTLTSGATWVTGQAGSAVNLDGADDYVQVGAQSSLVMTSAASFSAWIYPTGGGSDATYGGTILSKEGEYLLVRFPDGSIRWAFANSSPGWAFINTGSVAPLNQWTHVAVTYDNGVVKTYLNGTLANTYNGAGSIGDANASQNDFRIGGRQNISEYFQGRIDEVRVYNRALTATEVSTLNSTASSSTTADIEWLVTDQLGTPRMIFDKTGSLANTKRHDYLPFGEELLAGQGLRTTTIGYVADNTRQKFTQKERDNETGLDYFLARYYSSAHGRFTSPDEFAGGPTELFEDVDAHDPVFYADLANPQSLNKYHYALNNPLAFIDPDGHQESRTDRLIQGVADFVNGVGKGITSSITIGASGAPQPNDSLLNRAGQGVGTILTSIGGRVAIGAGGVSEVLTVGGSTEVSVPAVVGGVEAVVGSTVNAVRIFTTPMRRNTTSSSSDGRSGMDFTKKEKQQVIEQNEGRNNGATKCNNCGTQTVPGQQAKKGVPKPRNETNVDHVIPKSRGGRGRSDNGQVLCRECNQKKGNKMPKQE